jgi:hypothetical protein
LAGNDDRRHQEAGVGTSSSQEFRIGKAGWCLYSDEELKAPVYVRFGAHGGRLEVTAIHLASEERVTGTTLRSIPLGRIEAIANAPEMHEQIREAINNVTDRAMIATAESLAGFTSLVPERTPNALISMRWRREKTFFIPLDRPNGKRPDSFYSDVARRYTDLLRTYRNPAARLADERGVKPVTVHRWLKEARRRGLLGESSKSTSRSEK